MNRLIVVTVVMWSCLSMAQDTGSDVSTSSNGGGLFVEPSITYQQTDSEFNYGSLLGRSDGELNGFGLGARLGFHASEVFFVGVDGRYSQVAFKEDGVNYDADGKEMNFGPVVGIQMPDYGLRIWGTYIAGGNFDPDADGSFDVKFEEATGYRVGAGVRLKAFSINGEFQKLKYDKTKVQQLGTLTDPAETNSNNLETEAWIASISFPIEM